MPIKAKQREATENCLYTRIPVSTEHSENKMVSILKTSLGLEGFSPS